MEINVRPLNEIAFEIQRDWAKPFYGAVEYLNAMFKLKSMNDRYGFDSAYSIVAYFLANAATWRGETARRIKKELNRMLKMHAKNPNQFPEGKQVEPIFGAL